MALLRYGYGLDSNGYIVSDVEMEKINSIYLPCIQESIEGLKKLFHQKLHSVYVYGSVARGDAIPPKSDLDLIALFNDNLSSDELEELKQLGGELSQKYANLIREVGISVAYYEQTFDPANYYETAFIKEISVCIYGEDVGEQFGPYKLTSEIAISFNGDIKAVLMRTLKRLEAATDEDFKRFSQNFARKLIRTYYSMVMVRSQIWTTRLREQAEVFIQHFPSKESIILSLLNWVDEPPMDREIVYDLFKREGEWATANFVREASMTS
ncbi:nucleotidyltransferase domain-containing protein [Sutcliffiella rhizosphaerae]|uniref:Polymerase nucleotidyl transferase domain-containing protein n=1 Tax=Sutcliffiella rhizosphaerae TaxID=2880967 RepID=A0ABM8YUS6_9BACI|nr:nucleotidyltransferase domain-containing protein [Sutcliffiella rhizosphaerae]CAG9623727.1 hypothetical protein BACCIP111883_04559 [Sutcliffiella rhizosphaerae]